MAINLDPLVQQLRLDASQYTTQISSVQQTIRHFDSAVGRLSSTMAGQLAGALGSVMAADRRLQQVMTSTTATINQRAAAVAALTSAVNRYNTTAAGRPAAGQQAGGMFAGWTHGLAGGLGGGGSAGAALGIGSMAVRFGPAAAGVATAMFAVSALFGTLGTILHTGNDLLKRGFSSMADGLTNAVTSMFNLGMELEKAQVAFQVMLGGKEAGAAMLGDIQQLALRTPYNTLQMSGAAKMMMGMGVESGNIMPALSRLGDIAGGDPDKLRRLALVFSEVMSEGRMTGVRLRQFAGLGVGVQDFAETAGVRGGQFREKMREEGIGPNVVLGTINRLTEPGGRFHDLSAEGMKKVYGQWSNLFEMIEIRAATMATNLFEKFDVAKMIGGAADFVGQNWASVEAAVVPVLERVIVVAEEAAVVIRTLWDTTASALAPMFGSEVLTNLEKFRELVVSAFSTMLGYLQKILPLYLRLLSYQLEWQAFKVWAGGLAYGGTLTETGSGMLDVGRTMQGAARTLRNDIAPAVEFQLGNAKDAFDTNPAKRLDPRLMELRNLSPEQRRTRAEAGLLTKVLTANSGWVFGKHTEPAGAFGPSRMDIPRMGAQGGGDWGDVPSLEELKKERILKLRLELEAGPSVKAVVEDIRKQFEEGIHPGQKFLNRMAMIDKGTSKYPDTALGKLAYAHQKIASDLFGTPPPVGVAPGFGLTPAEIQFGKFEALQQLRKVGRDSLKAHADVLPAALSYGSAEAQDVINRAQDKTKDEMETLVDEIREANRISEAQEKLLAKAEKHLEHLTKTGVLRIKPIR